MDASFLINHTVENFNGNMYGIDVTYAFHREGSSLFFTYFQLHSLRSRSYVLGIPRTALHYSTSLCGKDPSAVTYGTSQHQHTLLSIDLGHIVDGTKKNCFHMYTLSP